MFNYKIVRILFISALCGVFLPTQTLNIYSWSGYFPSEVLERFTKKTGIKIYMSYYDSNEMLLERLKYQYKSYDIIVPSGYILEQLVQKNTLDTMPFHKFPNVHTLDEKLYHNNTNTQYGIPYLISATGMLINTKHHPIYQKWAQLWQPELKEKLLLLDDMREVFSMTLLSLEKDPNTKDLNYIHQAYHKLQQLAPNIRVFTNDLVTSLYANEEITIGMAWNGDARKAMRYNSNLSFIYPKEGFIISVDYLAIPKNAPHKEEAYQFINFLLQEEISAMIVDKTGYLLPNKKLAYFQGRNRWKEALLSHNEDILQNGILQRDIEGCRNVYMHDWEKLRISI